MAWDIRFGIRVVGFQDSGNKDVGYHFLGFGMWDCRIRNARIRLTRIVGFKFRLTRIMGFGIVGKGLLGKIILDLGFEKRIWANDLGLWD